MRRLQCRHLGIQRFGFRHRAHQRFASASPEERSLIEAYRQGVNEGLAGLGAPPFEYALLGVDPEPWRPEPFAMTEISH